MSKILVTWKKPYTFTNDQGVKYEGVKVSYLNKNASNKDAEVGHNPILSKLDLSLNSSLTTIPGLYDAEVDVQTNAKNQPELVITSLNFIKPVDIKSIFEAK
jgi:hypothetical protein